MVEDNRLLLNSLSSLELKLAQIRPAQARPGTFRWVFTSPSYTRWINLPKPSILLLTGPPGCGKSVLTRYVADFLPRVARAKSGNQYTVISYFCSYAEAASDTEAILLRSLLYQMVQLKPESGSIVTNRLAKRSGDKIKFELKTDKLWEALLETLSMNSTTHICLVLDAIEELGDAMVKSILRNLSHVTKYLENQQPRSRFKLLISSRRSYPNMKNNCDQLQMNKRQLETDILAYLDHAIDEFAEDNSSFNSATSSSLRRKIADTIAKSSNGTFLVAVLSWENFRTGADWSSKIVKKKLNSVMPLRSDMEDFYDSILIQGDKEALADAEMIFSIVGAAARPLTETELEELAGMCLAGKRIRSSTSFSPCQNIVRMMDERYPGLMTVQSNNRITLIHRSFKDYLENAHRPGQVIRMESRYLVRACLQYLQLEDLIQDAKSGLTRHGAYPCLGYWMLELMR